MIHYIKILKLVLVFFVAIFNWSCKGKNHIDKYEVNLDTLNTLPDGFYGHRRGNIYFDNGTYMIWLTRDNSGDVKNIFKITDLANKKADNIATLIKYKIDTTENKIQMQRFLDLSSKFKFGHISVDKTNKISFSYQDGLSEQYVIALKDSIKDVYLLNKEFKLLDNGWFEYIER
mgnify:CR=1 FL=1